MEGSGYDLFKSTFLASPWRKCQKPWKTSIRIFNLWSGMWHNTILHGVTSQKTVILIFTTVRASDHTQDTSSLSWEFKDNPEVVDLYIETQRAPQTVFKILWYQYLAYFLLLFQLWFFKSPPKLGLGWIFANVSILFSILSWICRWHDELDRLFKTHHESKLKKSSCNSHCYPWFTVLPN
jgi:hypothetical protein